MKTALSVLSFFVGSLAFAGNPGVTYQGRIFKPDGTAYEAASVEFRMQVKSADGVCLLYEESQNKVMTGSLGIFAITMNDGSGTRLDTPSYTLDRIFSNRGTFTLDATRCSAGTTYTPGSTDGRQFIVYFKDASMASYEPLPIMTLNYATQAMYALESQKLGSFAETNFLRAVDVSGNPVAAPAFDPTQLGNLNSLIAGTSTQYTTAASFATVQAFAKAALPTCAAGEVLKSNGTSFSCVVAATGGTGTVTSVTSSNGYLTIATGTTTPALTVNVGTAANTVAAGDDSRITGAMQTGAAAGGSLAGTYPNPTIAAGAITNTEISNTAAIADSKLATISTAGKVSGSAITSGTIGGSTVISTSGNIKTTGALQVFDAGPVNSVSLKAPASVTSSYTLTFPSAAPGSGQQLVTVDAAGTLGWAVPGGGGTVTSITAGTGLTGGAITGSGTIGLGTELTGLNGLATTGFVKRTAAGTYSTPAISLTADISGVLPVANGGTNSSTGLSNNRMMVSSGGAIVEAAALTDGQIVVGKSGSAPQLVDMSGDASISNTGAVTVSKINGTAVSGIGLANTNILQNNSGSAISGNSVLVSNAGGTGVTSLTSPASGVLTSSGTVPSWSASLPATQGGTGQTVYTIGDILFASSTSALSKLPASTNGFVLTSNGPGVAPSWQAAAGGGGSGTVTSIIAGTGLTGGTITATGTIGLGTELTGLNGLATTGFVKRTGAGAYSTPASIALATDVSGVLPVANGGTNSSASLNGNSLMISSGGAIVEAAAMLDGQLVVGKTGSAPQQVAMSGDATIANTGAVTLKNTGTAGTYYKVTTDAQGRVTAGSNLISGDITTALGYTPLNKAGDSMSGTLGLYATATDPSTAGWNATQKGFTWFNTTSNQVMYWDGSAIKSLGVSGSGLSSLGGQTGTTQTFAAGAAGTSPAISSGSDVHTLNVPLASGAGVTSGTISKTDYDAFTAKLGPASAFTGDVSGTSSTTSVDKIKGTAVTITALTTGNFLKYNGTAWVNSALSISDLSSGTLGVANGGTGATTLTSNGVLLGNGTSAVAATAAGTADQVLRIPGAGGAPAFGAIDLTKSAAVTGSLGIANGGTGASSFAANTMVASNGTGSALQAFTCTTGQTVAFGALGIVQCESTNGAGQLLRLDGSSNIAASASIIQTGMAAPAVSAAGSGKIYFDSTANKFKVSQNGGAYTDLVSAAGGSGTVTSIVAGTGLTGGTITASGTIGLDVELAGLNGLATTGFVKRTAAGTYSTPAVSLTADISGVLPVANGGTNSSTPLSSNRLMVSSGGAIVEAAAMLDGQLVVGKTGSAPQQVAMSGDATISNAGAVTVSKINGTAVSGIGLANTNILQNTSGSAISGNSVLVSNAGGTGVTSLTSPASGVLTSSGTVPSWSASLPASQGGTGLTSYTIGDMLYASSSSALSALPASTSGYVLTSNGAGVAPSWQAAAGSSALSSVTAATAGHTISNATNAQVWNWQLTGNTNAFTFGESAASTGGTGTQNIVNITNLASSTATPLNVVGTGSQAINVSNTGSGIGINVSSVFNPGVNSNSSDDTGVQGSTAVTGVGLGAGVKGFAWNNGYGVQGSSAGSFSGYFQSYSATNTSSTLVTQQKVASTADLFQAQNAAGTSLFNITSGGNVGIGSITPSTALDVAGAITNRGMAAPAVSSAGQGRIYFDSTSNKFKVSQNGAAYTDLVTAAGGGITSLGGQTGVTQTFAAGASGTAPAIASSGDVHTLNVPLASGAGVTSGTISKTDYDAFVAKLGTASTFTGDVSGTSSTMSVDKIKGTGVTITSITNGNFLKYNGTAWVNSNISASDVASGTLGVANGGTGATSLGSGNLLVGAGTGAVTSLAAGASGNVVYGTGLSSWASGSPDTAGLVDKGSVQSISGAKTFSAAVKVANQNLLTLGDGGTHNVSLRAPASITSDYTLTMPAAQGGASTVLTNDGSGNLSWAAGGGGSGTVTSIVAGTGLTGGTITSTGTIAVDTGTTAGKIPVFGANKELATAGQIYSAGYDAASGTSFNFNNGNIQYTAAACGSFSLSNMVSGGSYTIGVLNSSGTCTFTHGSDTTHYAGGVTGVTLTSYTVFTFAKMGTHIFVTWVTF